MNDDKPWGRKLRKPKIGDYVLAAKFSDFDPHDPWRVGYVVRVIQDKRGTSYIIGEHDGSWSDFREYRHCRSMTQEQGIAWLDFYRWMFKATEAPVSAESITTSNNPASAKGDGK